MYRVGNIRFAVPTRSLIVFICEKKNTLKHVGGVKYVLKTEKKNWNVKNIKYMWIKKEIYICIIQHYDILHFGNTTFWNWRVNSIRQSFIIPCGSVIYLDGLTSIWARIIRQVKALWRHDVRPASTSNYNLPPT